MAWSQVFNLDPPHFPYQFHIHGFSDLQIGSDSTSLSIIKKRVDEIVADPVDSGVFILGDIEDEDRPSTRDIRRSAFAGREEVIYRDADKHMAWIDKVVIPILLPLMGTKYGVMGVLAGHHWTQLSPVLNSPQYICNRLRELTKREVPYLGEMSSFVDLRVRCNGKGIRSVGHIQHGEGGGQSKGSTVSRLERTAQGFEADWYMRAHDCQLIATKTDRLYPREVKSSSCAPEMMSRTITMLNLGSATRGYQADKKTSYVERGMMRPTTMGWGTLLFSVRKARRFEDPGESYRLDVNVTI